MPRIPDIMLDVSIYLYRTKEDADKGTKAGGCGFVLAVPYEKVLGETRHVHFYAVTNAHVIAKGFPVIRVNTHEGTLDTISLGTSEWTLHKNDDIAICPFVPAPNHKVAGIGIHRLLSIGQLLELDINIGSDVFTIGRFMALDGKEHNNPVVRFGNISMMPREPIYNPETKTMQDSFIVEGRSASGFSGSLVFASNRNFESDEKQGGVLGIVWGHLNTEEKVYSSADQKPLVGDDGNPLGWYVRDNTGMMCVVPSWKIMELIQMPQFQDQRRQTEQVAEADLSDFYGSAQADVD